ncbi:MAG: hypothetical protein AB4372_04675 [Xenococcus sp. (in: cyanobacteria)]
MPNIPINLGDAFLIDTPPNGQHLYIAIAKTGNNKYLLRLCEYLKINLTNAIA